VQWNSGWKWQMIFVRWNKVSVLKRHQIAKASYKYRNKYVKRKFYVTSCR
jgi:hypothetical protein